MDIIYFSVPPTAKSVPCHLLLCGTSATATHHASSDPSQCSSWLSTLKRIVQSTAFFFFFPAFSSHMMICSCKWAVSTRGIFCLSATSAERIYRQCYNFVVWKISFMQNSSVPGSLCKSCLHLAYNAVYACIFNVYTHRCYFMVRQPAQDTEADV